MLLQLWLLCAAYTCDRQCIELLCPKLLCMLRNDDEQKAAEGKNHASQEHVEPHPPAALQVERVHQLISRVLDETGGPLDPEQPEQVWRRMLGRARGSQQGCGRAYTPVTACCSGWSRLLLAEGRSVTPDTDAQQQHPSAMCLQSL
jgi:hypothetical protein